VSVVRQTVEGLARRLAFASEEIEDVKLAVGEACTNAIKHGCNQAGFVTISCNLRPGCIEIEICNHIPDGARVPTLCVPPDPSHLNEGGLGLYLMRQLMDDVELSCEKGCATLTMRKMARRDR